MKHRRSQSYRKTQDCARHIGPNQSLDGCSDSLGCFLNTYIFYQRTDRGPSDFDFTHYFVASGLWDLPFPRERRNLVGKVFGDWQLGGILTASSGFPWSPHYSNGARPVAYLGPKQDTSNAAFMRPGGTFGPDASRLFIPNPFTISAVTPTSPAIGRNVFRGPHYFTVDMSLVKRIRLPKFIRLGDLAVMDLRANFFNIFNNLNLAPIYGDNTLIAFPHAANPDFGRASQALSGRVVEFQARLSF